MEFKVISSGNFRKVDIQLPLTSFAYLFEEVKSSSDGICFEGSATAYMY